MTMPVTTHVADKDPTRPLAPSWDTYAEWLVGEWQRLLGSDPTEPDMHEFLERHPSLLPGATDSVGWGGHHGQCWEAVVSKPPLAGVGPDRVPDFMWLRRDSQDVKPICIEIEAPNKKWYTNDVVPTAQLTQAIDQLREWRAWFDKPSNHDAFKERYVPNSFRHRTLEPEFVLVYGRDAEFHSATIDPKRQRARAKRDMLRSANEHLYTYDMLRPHIEARVSASVKSSVNDGFEVLALPPTFSTGPSTASDVGLSGIVDSIAHALPYVDLIDDARRSYVLDRWNYWTSLKGTFAIWNGDYGE